MVLGRIFILDPPQKTKKNKKKAATLSPLAYSVHNKYYLDITLAAKSCLYVYCYGFLRGETFAGREPY